LKHKLKIECSKSLWVLLSLRPLERYSVRHGPKHSRAIRLLSPRSHYQLRFQSSSLRLRQVISNSFSDSLLATSPRLLTLITGTVTLTTTTGGTLQDVEDRITVNLLLKLISDSGLRMITFSNVSEYLYSSSQAGVRITISKQNFSPFPNTYGYNVGVGSYVAVPVEYVMTIATLL
jgi:hypothetical protein